MPISKPDHVDLGFLNSFLTDAQGEISISGFISTTHVTAVISPDSPSFTAQRIDRTERREPLPKDEWPPSWKPGGHPGHPPNPIPTIPVVDDVPVDINSPVQVNPTTTLLYSIHAHFIGDLAGVPTTATLSMVDASGVVLCRVPLSVTTAPQVLAGSTPVFLTQGQGIPLAFEVVTFAKAPLKSTFAAKLPSATVLGTTTVSLPAGITEDPGVFIQSVVDVSMGVLADTRLTTPGDTQLQITMANSLSATVPVAGEFPVATMPAVISPFVQPPPGGLTQGRVNYFFASFGFLLTDVRVDIEFTHDFVSSQNGFGFQLNCYSPNGPGITTHWQQYLIFMGGGTNTLVAAINNWENTSGWIILAEKVLTTLPDGQLKAGRHKLSIQLLQNADARVTGAQYTVAQDGTVLASEDIVIMGQPLWDASHGTPTDKKATSTNLAPITSFTFDIGGDDNAHTAHLTSGSGTATYSAGVPLTVLSTEPGDEPFRSTTAETANLAFGELPPSQATSITQSFKWIPSILHFPPPVVPPPHLIARPRDPKMVAEVQRVEQAVLTERPSAHLPLKP